MLSLHVVGKLPIISQVAISGDQHAAWSACFDHREIDNPLYAYRPELQLGAWGYGAAMLGAAFDNESGGRHRQHQTGIAVVAHHHIASRRQDSI